MSMSDRDGLIWLDGSFVPWREAKLHVLSHSLHYGMGVFEGIRCYETASGPGIFRLHDHAMRLFRSAHILGMNIPFSVQQISDACKDVVLRNNLANVTKNFKKRYIEGIR